MPPYEQLKQAVIQGDIEKTRRALAEGADPFGGMSLAIRGENPCLTVLLEAGASPNWVDETGIPFFVLARRQGNRYQAARKTPSFIPRDGVYAEATPGALPAEGGDISAIARQGD